MNLELIAVLLTITGFFLIEEKRKEGFYLSGLGNIIWVIAYYKIAGIYFFILQGFLFLIAIKGILKNG